MQVGTIPMAAQQAAPAPATDALRGLLQAARDELAAETRLARGGLRSLGRYADRVDGLVRELHGAAREQTDAPAAVVALGGYGRRQLCMHSDIDLLFVFGAPLGAPEERFLRSILHPLWDLRLDVGHHVREIAELERADTDNPEFLVALLEARFLAGDAALFEQLTTLCQGPDAAWRDPMLAALRDLLEQRHAQFNRTLYHLEPDLKNAPGALRDISAVRMITQFEDPARRLDVRVKIGRVDEAEDFLLRIRSILHLKLGRNLNVLTHELQDAAARMFGSPDDPPERQVEALMSTYFHHARIVNRALAWSLKALATNADAPPVDAADVAETADVADVADGLQRRDGEIAFTDGTRASLQPRIWLRAFETALDEGCAVSEQVLTCIERHGGRYAPERFFPTTAERDVLLRILRPRPGLYARLSEMHECGLLGRMFPEFHKIYCHVIRDFYHKYTVDEHTLQTIRNLELLRSPTTPSRRRFAELLAETPGAELLAAALLFHDVGKWTNRNHAEESVRMALAALRRIRLAEPDVATVEFLIRNHLRMSTAAFRRDTDDPDVVVQFARLVGNEQRLKLLCLLTLVDVSAVGPEVMTPWKEDLLWRLYVDTYNRLTRGYSDEVIDTAAASLAELRDGCPADLSQRELENFLAGLPQRYLRLVDKPHVYEHARLARNLRAPDVRCTLEQKGSAWELSVVSADQPRLFSKVCGVLSYFGMDILRGQALTNRQGLAVDIVEFTDRERFFALNPEARPDLTNLLAEVVGGRQDIDAILAPKQRGLARRGPTLVKPVVHFDNEYSERFSILEVLAQDAWGLLYRISAVISRHGCDIEFVLISTEGNRAIDVFHLTRSGAKLSAADTAALKRSLEALLETDNKEADQ